MIATVVVCTQAQSPPALPHVSNTDKILGPQFRASQHISCFIFDIEFGDNIMKLLTTLVLSCLLACKARSYQTLSVSAFQRCRLRRTTGRQRLFTIYIKSTDNLEHLKR